MSSEPPAAKKCKTPTNAPSDSCDKHWWKIGENVDTDERKRGRRITLLVAISHDGKRVAFGSFVYHANGSTTVKFCDCDGIGWNEVGRFSRKGFDVHPIGRNLALSGNGKRLAIGNGNETKQETKVYQYHEGSHWNDLWKIWGGWDYLSLSADGSRAAVRFDVRSGVKLFECDLDMNRRVVRAIVGEADWGALILEFLGFNWNQIGQDLFTEVCISDLSLSADGTTIAVACKDRECVKVFRFSNNGNGVQIGQDLNHCSRHALGKKLGQSLSINATGNIVAIGTPATFGCV